jgi:hypothetical protein
MCNKTGRHVSKSWTIYHVTKFQIQIWETEGKILQWRMVLIRYYLRSKMYAFFRKLNSFLKRLICRNRSNTIYNWRFDLRSWSKFLETSHDLLNGMSIWLDLHILDLRVVFVLVALNMFLLIVFFSRFLACSFYCFSFQDLWITVSFISHGCFVCTVF